MAFYIPCEEQETTISFSRTEESAYIWTNDRTVMTKLDALCRKSPKMYLCTKVTNAKDSGEVMDKRYEIKDKGLISFRAERVKLTDEQKAERAKHLRSYNQNPSGKTA